MNRVLYIINMCEDCWISFVPLIIGGPIVNKITVVMSHFKCDQLKTLRNRILKSKSNPKNKVKFLLEFIILKYGLIIPFYRVK